MGISRKEALECLGSDDLVGIGMEADAVRRRLHPDGIVSYVIDGEINILGTDPFEEIERIVASGGSAVIVRVPGSELSESGLSGSGLSLEGIEGLLRSIKGRYPALWVHGLSATAILGLAGGAGLAMEETIARLHGAGLDSIAGDDAGILDDAVTSEAGRLKTAEWIGVHRAAHRAGIQTTATMWFGGGETLEHRVNHLEAVRQLQEETGGFASFAPSPVMTANALTPGFEEATAVEYLKTLAVCRMYLDNIANMQSSLETQGLKVLQVGLRFGGNDTGSILLARAPHAATEEQVRHAIRDAGFRPVERDTLYRTMYLN